MSLDEYRDLSRIGRSHPGILEYPLLSGVGDKELALHKPLVHRPKRRRQPKFGKLMHRQRPGARGRERSECAGALGLFAATLVALLGFHGEAKEGKVESGGEKVDVAAERPFDGVNIFGDFGKKFTLPNTEENKIWWERMVRGEVGKDRFLILCALKDGKWKHLADIRTYIEFKIGETYSFKKLSKLLVLMAGKPRNPMVGRPRVKHVIGEPVRRHGEMGEGWLEKNPGGESWGIDSEWRIESSVYPLLYFLLMGCPGDGRCE